VWSNFRLRTEGLVCLVYKRGQGISERGDEVSDWTRR
jgi:hypothetical protein